MYRLAIYFLASLLLFAALFSWLDVLPYNPWHIILSSIYLVLVSCLFNLVFAKIIKTKANTESAFITALILSLIVGPLPLFENLIFFTFLAFAAMASKYIIAWRGRHIFNPAALAVVLSAVILNQGASWWVGSKYLVPLVLIFGLTLLKKIKRGKLVISFLVVYFALTILAFPNTASSFDASLNFIWQLLIFSPILFFAFIMLTEPQTSPKKSEPRTLYGVITAIVVVLYQKYLKAPYTLELALLTGNIFAYVISPAVRTSLKLKKREKKGSNIYSFWFNPERKIKFKPGQFLEWTMYHKKSDSRGIRRYFTIASSPTEQDVLLTAKFPIEPSTFKKTLSDTETGDSAIATGPEGEFILPKKQNKKIAFIAGGIGITPFRSMVKYLLDKNLSRDIVLLYCANSPDEFVFKDIFNKAKNEFGLKTVYAISDKSKIPADWKSESGLIDADMIKRQTPDWQERLFYISGPQPMVKAIEKILSQMGVSKNNIKRDYFPGYEEI